MLRLQPRRVRISLQPYQDAASPLFTLRVVKVIEGWSYAAFVFTLWAAACNPGGVMSAASPGGVMDEFNPRVMSRVLSLGQCLQDCGTLRSIQPEQLCNIVHFRDAATNDSELYCSHGFINLNI